MNRCISPHLHSDPPKSVHVLHNSAYVKSKIHHLSALSRATNSSARPAIYHLDYGDLKELARNSIEYSFLAGHSLFRTHEFEAWVPACRAGVDSDDLAWPEYRDPLGADCRAYLDHTFRSPLSARVLGFRQETNGKAAGAPTPLRRARVDWCKSTGQALPVKLM